MKKAATANPTILVLGAGTSIGAAKYPIESSLRQAMAKMPSGPNFFTTCFSKVEWIRTMNATSTCLV